MTASYLLPLVADLPATPIAEALSTEISFWRILSLILLILLNAFFVAAEVALLRVHESQLEEAVGNGRRGAKLGLKVARNSGVYSAACQLGITLSSIIMGAIGVPLVAAWVSPLLAPLGLSPMAIDVTAFLFSVAVITLLHVIIGEQIPKSFGFNRTIGTTIACSQPLRLFYMVVAGPIWLIEKVSDAIIRGVFRLDPGDVARFGHTADELRLMVEETGRAKEVTQTEQEILSNALELNDLYVKDILTPRNEVVTLDVHHTFRENLEIALESKHTRFPLVDGHLDKTLGLIHIKDLLREMQRESMNLFAAKRDLIRVSEKLPLDEMLQLFLSKRAHVALVVDEFGGSLGLVMLDDVLDQVVGEILDEFDEEEETGFTQIDQNSFVVEGAFPLHELSDQVNNLDLEEHDVSTVGGYVTSVIGRIPESGETIALPDYKASILQADDRSVQLIQFTKTEDHEESVSNLDDSKENESN